MCGWNWFGTNKLNNKTVVASQPRANLLIDPAREEQKANERERETDTKKATDSLSHDTHFNLSHICFLALSLSLSLSRTLPFPTFSFSLCVSLCLSLSLFLCISHAGNSLPTPRDLAFGKTQLPPNGRYNTVYFCWFPVAAKLRMIMFNPYWVFL